MTQINPRKHQGNSIAVAVFVIGSMFSIPAPVMAAGNKKLLFGVAPVGEITEYKIFFSGIEAGTQRVEVQGITTVRGEEVFHLVSRLTSIGALAQVYKLDDKLESYVSSGDARSVLFIKDILEGSYRAWDRYEISARELKLEKRRGKDLKDIRFLIVPIDGPVLDAVSLVFYLRGELARLGARQGMKFKIPVIDKEKRMIAPAVVVKIEVIDTCLGPRRAAMIKSPVTGSVFWFSLEDGFIPLRMEVQTTAGMVTGELKSYTVKQSPEIKNKPGEK